MLLSPADLANSSIIDPQILEFAAANPSPPLDWNDVSAVRALMDFVEEATNAAIGPPPSDIIESEREILMNDGYSSKIKIHKPALIPESGSPMIVLCFGGGFVSGSRHQLTGEARSLVQAFGAVVVNIEYRLSPEHLFPKCSEDGWDSVKWLSEHGSELDANLDKGFIIGGISAGALISATICRKAQIEKLPKALTGQWLSVPSLMNIDLHRIPEKYKPHHLSREQNKDAPIFPLEAMYVVAKHTAWDESSLWRSPFNSEHSLSGLPPAYLQVDGLDILRDDSLIYDELLKEAGVKTKIDFYPGCPHAHANFMPGLEVTTRAQADTVKGFGWLLNRETMVDGAGK